MTKIDKTLSNKESLVIGVPQGSILGPLFFLIFINDFYWYLSIHKPELLCTLFADDTTLFDSGTDIDKLISIFSESIIIATEWTNINRLSINFTPTLSIGVLFDRNCLF